MPDDPTDAPAQAAVVLQLTGRAGALPLEQLHQALQDVSADRITAALSSLAEVDVVRLTALAVYPSASFQRLDALGMICV
jgi:hypothetical protein